MEHVESWAWMIGLGLFLFGVAAGLALSRIGDTYWKRQQNLEKELDVMAKEFQAYRGDVTHHFVTTAQLVNNMSKSYRAVFDHLAISSHHLCGDKLSKALDFDKQKHLLDMAAEELNGRSSQKQIKEENEQPSPNKAIEDASKHADLTSTEAEFTAKHDQEPKEPLIHDADLKVPQPEASVTSPSQGNDQADKNAAAANDEEAATKNHDSPNAKDTAANAKMSNDNLEIIKPISTGRFDLALEKTATLEQIAATLPINETPVKQAIREPDESTATQQTAGQIETPESRALQLKNVEQKSKPLEPTAVDVLTKSTDSAINKSATTEPKQTAEAKPKRRRKTTSTDKPAQDTTAILKTADEKPKKSARRAAPTTSAKAKKTSPAKRSRRKATPSDAIVKEKLPEKKAGKNTDKEVDKNSDEQANWPDMKHATVT